MSGMRFTPKGYDGARPLPERVKRDGWREQGLLAVAVDDERLTWPERAGAPARRQALRQAAGRGS